MFLLSSNQVVLVYNVATYWGLTTPSYTQINELANYYAGQDLVILGFPCNQFGLVRYVSIQNYKTKLLIQHYFFQENIFICNAFISAARTWGDSRRDLEWDPLCETRGRLHPSCWSVLRKDWSKRCEWRSILHLPQGKAEAQ